MARSLTLQLGQYPQRWREGLARFWAWWSGELESLAPAWLQRRLEQRRCHLVLRVDGQDITLSHRDAGGETCLGVWRAEEERPPAFMAELPELRRILLLPPAAVLQQTVILPAAARENLRQVVAFEINRYTPFGAEALYFDVEETAGGSAADPLRVRLVATPKPVLERALEALAERGLRPDRVDVDAPEAWHKGRSIDLLPHGRGAQESRLHIGLGYGLALLLFVLLSAVTALPVLLDRQFVGDLRDQLRHSTAAAKEVEALREKAEQAQRETEFIGRKKNQEAALVQVLDELSQRIPDTTWLTSLQYRDHRLTLQGQSEAASALIGQIDGSPLFKNTSFASPVIQDSNTHRERFQITTEIDGEYVAQAAKPVAAHAVPAEEENVDEEEPAESEDSPEPEPESEPDVPDNE